MSWHHDVERDRWTWVVGVSPMQPESSGMTVEEITHAVIDALERVGTGGDYYKINHSSRAEIEELAKMIAGWLARRGIAVVE